MASSVMEEGRVGGEEKEEEGKTRIHIGGLGETVTSDDLTKIFAHLGNVKSVEIIRTKGRSFAYVDFFPSSDKSLSKLFSTYNGCVWKGGRLRLEKAKEHYLVHLKKEWEEDAQLEISPPVKVVSPSEMPKKVVNSEKKLNIFFPRLRKVKPLPLSGTGKHKYSFQRVEAPPLPSTFCDCEEHSVFYDAGKVNQIHEHAAEVKETHDPEALGGGVNEEELNIMNSVMKRLFDRENMSNEVVGPEENNQVKASTFPKNQELVSNERRTFTDGPVQSVPRESNLPPDKKRKSVRNEESTRHESVPGEVESAGKHSSWLQKSSWKALVGDKGSSVFSVCNLLPDGSAMEEGDNAFKSSIEDMQLDDNEVDEDEDDLVINVLPKKNSQVSLPKNKESEIISTVNKKSTYDERHSSEDTANDLSKEKKKGSLPPKKKRKSLVNECVGNIIKDDKNLQTRKSESEASLQAQPDSGVKLSAKIRSYSGNSSENDLAADGGDDAFGISHLSPVVSAGEERHVSNDNKNQSIAKNENLEVKSDEVEREKCGEEVKPMEQDAFGVTSLSPEVSAGEEHHLSDDNKNQSIENSENLEGRSDEIETEKCQEEVKPTGHDEALKKSNKRSLWFQKSSWTQLVSDNNSSFSITHIAPSTTFYKSELKEFHPSDIKSKNNLVKQNKTEATKHGSSASEDEKAVPVIGDSSGKNEQTVASNNETSALTAENTYDLLQEETTKEGVVVIGETCSFMRSSASIKEWTKAKASLSGAHKRKRIEK